MIYNDHGNAVRIETGAAYIRDEDKFDYKYASEIFASYNDKNASRKNQLFHLKPGIYSIDLQKSKDLTKEEKNKETRFTHRTYYNNNLHSQELYTWEDIQSSRSVRFKMTMMAEQPNNQPAKELELRFTCEAREFKEAPPKTIPTAYTLEDFEVNFGDKPTLLQSVEK